MSWHVPPAPPPEPSPGPLPRPSRTRNSIEVDVHASVGIVRPGDKLVIAIARLLDTAETEELRQMIEERLPGVEGVIIEAESLVVYRG